MKRIYISLGIIFLPILLLLLSYTFSLNFTPLTSAQKESLDFVELNKPLFLNYTVLEKSHLEDVQVVMNYEEFIFYLLLLGYFCLLSQIQLQDLVFIFRYGGLLSLLVFILSLLLIFTHFETIFTFFHYIFFPQGNWQFPADSLLITVFPLKFFIWMAIKIFGGAFLLATFLFGSSFYIKYEN